LMVTVMPLQHKFFHAYFVMVILICRDRCSSHRRIVIVFALVTDALRSLLP
jgi:hypothetical protein